MCACSRPSRLSFFFKTNKPEDAYERYFHRIVLLYHQPIFHSEALTDPARTYSSSTFTPLNITHLHGYFCIALPAVISLPGYDFDKTNEAFHHQTLFHRSSTVKAIYRTDARGAACDTKAVTTQPWTIYKGLNRVPANSPISNSSILQAHFFRS